MMVTNAKMMVNLIFILCKESCFLYKYTTCVGIIIITQLQQNNKKKKINFLVWFNCVVLLCFGFIRKSTPFNIYNWICRWLDFNVWKTSSAIHLLARYATKHLFCFVSQINTMHTPSPLPQSMKIYRILEKIWIWCSILRE